MDHPTVSNSSLILEWSCTNTIDPTTVTTGSGRRALWNCAVCRHTWESRIIHRANGSGCPLCAGRVVVTGVNDLVTTHPHLSKEWSLLANKQSPTKVSYGSHLKVTWVCLKCKHSWRAAVSNRSLGGNGCPECKRTKLQNRIKAIKGMSDLASVDPALAEEWDPSNHINIAQVTYKSGKRVGWVCSKCAHKWKSTVANRSNGSGCPECNKRISLVEVELCKLLNAENNVRLETAWASGKPHVVDGLLGSSTVIEYDGSYWHRDRVSKDLEKTLTLTRLGFTVVRVREFPLSFLPAHEGLIQVTHDFLEDRIEETAQRILYALANLRRHT